MQKETFAQKMRQAGLSELRVRQFLKKLEQLESDQGGMLPEPAIEPVEQVTTLADLPSGVEAPLQQVAVIKLNGGLGTSMGLAGPKSLLKVRGDLTFLDIVIRQNLSLGRRAGRTIPLLLMNSFATSAESLEVIGRYPELRQDLPFEFLQSKVPKIHVDSMAPAEWPDSPEHEWCPPGHGDLYPSMLESGILQTLLDQGIRYAFVSNIDNLGATLDERILAWFADRQAPFLMEVTRRTPADRKGGHLARRDGRLLLREVAQCPQEDLEQFQNIDKHRFFNTNNLWLNLEQLRDQIEELDLPLITNRKTLLPHDPSTPGVIQLESAMGAAISELEGSLALDVPRTRFAPVKKTSDLLAVRSDAYELDPVHFTLSPIADPPNVELDDRYFKNVDDFERRFQGAVSLRHCTRLCVEGDVTFRGNVAFHGEAEIKAK